MRDIIWTVVVIWLIYKLVDLLRAATSKKSAFNSQSNKKQETTSTPPKKDLQAALQKHLNKEGEYVDFEEIK